MKRLALALLACLPICAALRAQEAASPIHPISNPVYNETAIPQSRISVIYAYHRLPDKIRTELGKLALGGEVNLIAVQVEYALDEDLSLVANKDGYVWLDPDNTLSSQDGFGDLSAGLKYRLWQEDTLHLAVRGTIELPTGDEEVLQGNGDGNFSPAVILTHVSDQMTCNAVGGLVIPFDGDEESLMSYLSLSYSYQVTPMIAPMLELNWWHVVEPGEGEADFGGEQGGQTVGAVAQFEGGDYFNLGAANADANRNLVTAAVGATFCVTDAISLALAYEVPLTDEEASLFDDRVSANCTIRF